MSRNDQSPDRTFRIGAAEVAARPIEPGLHIVATPIGNLGDITLRALETLASADVLACEDTRTTRVLLDRYGIRRRSVAYHEHNAEKAAAALVARLDEGGSVALVSDAGTPLVSDPGYRLVRAALEAGHRVFPVPGASAAIAALSASGLATDSFHFAGFLPARQGARSRRLSELADMDATLILYESPNRLAAALRDMRDVLGETRQAVVARELTKLHEEFARGTLEELAARYEGDAAPRGEIVVLVAPAESTPPAEVDVNAILAELSLFLPASRAAAEAARRTGLPKQELYRRILALKSGDADD